MLELDSQGQNGSVVYTKLEKQKVASLDGLAEDDIVAVRKTLTDTIHARIYIHRAEASYEQYRCEVSNGYLSRSHEQPIEVAEAYRQIEYYQPIVYKKKTLKSYSKLKYKVPKVVYA